MSFPRSLALAVLLLVSSTLFADPFGPPVQLTSTAATQVSLAYTTDDLLVLSRADSVVRVKASRVAGDGYLVTDSAVRAAISAIEDRGLVVWTSASGAVLAMRLSSTGEPAGSAVRIGDLAAGSIAIAASGDRYLVAWQGNLDNVYATLLDSGAGVRVPSMPISTIGLAPIGELAAASNGDGFAVVWHSWAHDLKIFAVTLDHNAQPVNLEPLVVAENGLFPDVTSNGSHYFVAWGNTDYKGVRARTLAPDRTLGRIVSVSSDPGAAAPRIAWDGSAYSAAFIRIAQPRPGLMIPFLSAVRIRESGGAVETLGSVVPFFGQDFELVARDGVVDLVVSGGLTRRTAVVHPPRVRSRAVRH
jgi:hypothetical protein